MAKPFTAILFYLTLSANFALGQVSTDRQFDDQAIQNLAQQTEFQYTRDFAKDPSWFSSIFQWLTSWLSEAFDSPNTFWIGENLFRILIILAIIGAILLIIKIKYGKALSSDSTYLGSFVQHQNNIEDINYDKLYRKALEKRETKLAVRYLYLRVIQHLHRKGELNMTLWKTALDYLDEVKESQKEALSQLTKLFQATWYGDINPSEEDLKKGITYAEQLSGK